MKLARGPNGEVVTLEHDACERVLQRTVARNGFRPQTWRFGWNAQDQMVRAECPDGDIWTYAYNPFGRRVSKACKHTKVTFIWDGDVVAREITERADRVDVVDWFFEPGSFRPLARLEAGDLTYVINDHLGTPKEVVGGDGGLRWSGDHDTWGTLRTRSGKASAQIETGDYWTEPTSIDGNTSEAYTLDPDPDALYCPIRFQGQWEDGETGLTYNRHRYYDTYSGSFCSSDPVRLLADIRLFGYVENPSSWSDPFGLGPCRCCGWGSFAGDVGNSIFTPDNPASLGLPNGATIPFNNGTPDFGEFTRSVAGLPGEFSVPGLTGDHGSDRRLIIRQMAQSSGLTQSEITRMIGRSGQDLRLHHVGGDRIQVVPAQTHRLPHYGGAAELRDNC